MEFRELKADEIDVRVQRVGQNNNGYYAIFLLYKDARCDMTILDETVGCLKWKREHEVVNNNLFCTVSIFDDASGQWISKQDVGVESNTEKEKGQASDAFKRACVNWGIGRELYTAPFIFVNLRDNEVKKASQGRKPSTYLKLSVSKIEYENKKIVELELIDENGNVRFLMSKKTIQETKSQEIKPQLDITNVMKINASLVCEMDTLGIDFRGKLSNLVFKYSGLRTQDTTELALEDIDKLNSTYASLIKKFKEQQGANQNGIN